MDYLSPEIVLNIINFFDSPQDYYNLSLVCKRAFVTLDTSSRKKILFNIKEIIKFVDQGNIKALKYLLKNNPNYNLNKWIINSPYFNGNCTLLDIGYYKGHQDVVRLLYEYGAIEYDINLLFKCAIISGNYKLVNTFLLYNMIDVKDDNEYAIKVCVENRYYELTTLLLKFDEEININIDNSILLINSIKNHDYYITELLLSFRAELTNRLILQEGIVSQDIEIINLLIIYGINLNDELDNGYHPLEFAICLKNKKIIKLLIRNGSDISLCKLTHNIFFNSNLRKTYIHDPYWIYNEPNYLFKKLISKYGLKCDNDLLELFLYLEKRLEEFPPLNTNEENVNTDNISTFIYLLKNNLL